MGHFYPCSHSAPALVERSNRLVSSRLQLLPTGHCCCPDATGRVEVYEQASQYAHILYIRAPQKQLTILPLQLSFHRLPAAECTYLEHVHLIPCLLQKLLIETEVPPMQDSLVAPLQLSSLYAVAGDTLIV